jgi:DNA invertase Pin-like site-specific DNA recombinase
MLQECRNGNIDIIFTKTISRFGRNQLELLKTLEELDKIGVRVIFELENIDMFRDKKAIMTVIKSYLAENELKNDKKATNFGIKRMFESGKVRYSNKFPLFGFAFDENRRLVIKQNDAEIVKEIFDRYCSQERVVDIVKSLNDRKIKTASGKEWNYDSIARVLKQEKYTGKAILQKTYCKDGKKVKNSGQKAMYVVENYCTPIITDEQFEKAKQIRLERKRFKQVEYDCFKGKIRCGLCGGSYIKLQSGHRVYASGKRERIVYQCYKTHVTAMRECRNKVQSLQALQDGFCSAFNMIKQKIKNGEKIIYQNSELLSIQRQIKELLDKEKIYLLLEARERLSPLMRNEYQSLIEKILQLQKREKEIKKLNAELQIEEKSAKIFENFDDLQKFDEKIFLAVIKDIVVMGKNQILYNFKNGYTADVEIIDYYRKNDEIGRVNVQASI